LNGEVEDGRRLKKISIAMDNNGFLSPAMYHFP
jgi:hypothetical protein